MVPKELLLLVMEKKFLIKSDYFTAAAQSKE
jgi:hypothetical protein